MTKYYAAVDMGASSGRLILGHMENGRMELEEIHRFENGMVKKDGELCWEFDRIFKEIVAGLKKCKEIGKIPVSMLIPGVLTSFFLIKMTRYLVTQLDTVTIVQREWMRKFTS